MKKYLATFRIRFSNSLQYRGAALAGMMTQFAWGFMEILVFWAFYQANPATFPMEFSQTVSYIWMQQAFLALFMVWFFEAEIFDAISSGGIAYEMVRPIDLYGRWFCQSTANRLSKAVLRCLPILLIAFAVPEPFRMSLPADGVQFLLFVISAVLSLCVVVAFSMLVYIVTFYTLSPMGVRILSAVLADFLAGRSSHFLFSRNLSAGLQKYCLLQQCRICRCAFTTVIFTGSMLFKVLVCRHFGLSCWY